MKRDLIYLTLIVSAIWAAHATAKAVQDGPQQIEPRKIEAGFTKTVHILFPSPVTYIDIGSMDIIFIYITGNNIIITEIRINILTFRFPYPRVDTIIGQYQSVDTDHATDRRSLFSYLRVL